MLLPQVAPRPGVTRAEVAVEDGSRSRWSAATAKGDSSVISEIRWAEASTSASPTVRPSKLIQQIQGS